MSDNPRPWSIILFIAFSWLMAFGVILFSKLAWLILAVVFTVMVTSALILWSNVSTQQKIAVFNKLRLLQNTEENLLPYRLLNEILLSGADKKTVQMRASDVIRKQLQTERFVIFFRENEKFIPRLYSGVNKNDLSAPAIYKLGSMLKKDIQTGAISTSENDYLPAFKSDQIENFKSPVSFAYSWGRGKSVFAVVDDKHGNFQELIKDPNFNMNFWPGLESNIRINIKLSEANFEAQLSEQQLQQAKKEINELNHELKNKLLSLNSFVKISNDLYSLFNEDQLFSALKEIICQKVNTGVVEIMVPNGDSKYVVRTSENNLSENQSPLILDIDSELYALLSRVAKPILLPLIGSGLRQNEPFLGAAMGNGIQVATAIKVGGQIACILLIGQKNDKTQFIDMDLDFLSLIGNMASLALDNIHQYTTIEKLSYTDSMTGVYNYRYFYKRLSEEILRAKRYDRELSLVILDIDNFKTFNDNYGHQAGDLVLKQLSDLVTRTIRSIDVVSRYGGEEFCILMPDTGISNCEIFIERLRSQIAEFKFESEMFKNGGSISVSVGGAVFPHHALTPDRLIYCADMSLLQAKSLGRNRAIMYKKDLSLEPDSTEGGINERHQESIL
jgi:diguanylate cyclase (GGDEF)-like protein